MPKKVEKRDKPLKKKNLLVKKNVKKVFVAAVQTKSQPAVAKDANVSIARSSKTKIISLLRGMKDLLPKDENYWHQMYHVAEDITKAYGYGMIETPVLEDAGLFIRTIGRGTDIVDKEMYVFEDHDGTRVGLRPEFTAGVVRAYIGHGMQSQPQPIKLWSWGQVFRHDRPQAGRYRQFHQLNCENFGVHDPAVDAELIVVAYNFLRDLEIATTVQINSIGTTEDRQNYIIELAGYLRSKRSYLCDDCKRRISKNPLRVLDCKNEQCQPIIEEAPQIIDWLSDESKSYFMKVLEYLDVLQIPYVLKSTLVRGLDYYTETVFELYEEEREGVDPAEGRQGALVGGGRYDLLIEQLGGNPTPACGFAMGLERILTILRRKSEEGKKKQVAVSNVFFAQLGEQARQQALRIIENLRQQGIFVIHNLGKSALKAQLELANKYEANYTLILGQKEVQDGTIIVRDMESGIQEIIDQNKLVQVLRKKVKNV